jgi:hypothetical protein
MYISVWSLWIFINKSFTLITCSSGGSPRVRPVEHSSFDFHCFLMYEIFCLYYSYVRLELLEGVVAYYNGHTEKARDSLSSAQSKFMQVYMLAVIIF